uniref:PDZ domain-containing protein n=1 Tax=Oryza punctata TaxID=4537 RepID=A0A0E0LF90_ORYPU
MSQVGSAPEMPFPSDGDSSCSEDIRNEGHQRRELLEGESSRRELSAVVERRAYNLRPRKDDSVTTQQRLEFARWRQQRTQQRIERKEAVALKQKQQMEFIERASKTIKEMMDRMPKAREVDLENRTDILNTDTGGTMEMEKWCPYFDPFEIGLHTTTLKSVSWAVEELALQAAACVVGLQSRTDVGTDHFFCSGTIVECSEGCAKIVTVANLVKKCPDTDDLAEGLMITVYLQNNKACRGHLLYHDFFYNICVIEIPCSAHIAIKGFTSNINAINFDESCSRDVVSLGRDKRTHGLLVYRGKIIPKRSSLDCEELLVSTCRISKVEVGGPLMNFDGNFIGLNYYHYKETPFIPSFIVVKCLQQLKLFRKVVRPWPGLRVRNLFTGECNAFEKMQTNLLRSTCVIIEKIEDQSSVKAYGLNEGDIINRVNGVYFSNAAELGSVLLDIGTAYLSKYQNSKQLDGSDMISICMKFGVSGHGGERTVVVDKLASSGVNRWPFPKPIIVQEYADGKKVLEEWYAMES